MEDKEPTKWKPSRHIGLIWVASRGKRLLQCQTLNPTLNKSKRPEKKKMMKKIKNLVSSVQCVVVL